MIETIEVRFKWGSVVPDKRKWRPSRPYLEPIATVVILVPAKDEYIHNLKQVQESDGAVPELTLKGFKYCIDQLENTMSDPEEQAEENLDIEFDFSDEGEWE